MCVCVCVCMYVWWRFCVGANWTSPCSVSYMGVFLGEGDLLCVCGGQSIVLAVGWVFGDSMGPFWPKIGCNAFSFGDKRLLDSVLPVIKSPHIDSFLIF